MTVCGKFQLAGVNVTTLTSGFPSAALDVGQSEVLNRDSGFSVSLIVKLAVLLRS